MTHTAKPKAMPSCLVFCRLGMRSPDHTTRSVQKCNNLLHSEALSVRSMRITGAWYSDMASQRNRSNWFAQEQRTQFLDHAEDEVTATPG